MPATLLLADDSVTIQRVIELTFAAEDVRVVAVNEGRAVLEWLRQGRPDVVLADVGLPGVDGYELTTAIKTNPELSQVPVLLLTGAFEPIDENLARTSGCDGVLVKPFEPQRLVSLVKELLAGERPAALWPADMPRVEQPRAAAAPAAHATPAAHPTPVPVQVLRSAAPAPPAQVTASVRFDQIEEPGALTPTAVPQGAFETGLDDLDMAFSRLDPVAPPSKIDADAVIDFRRDLEELRNVGPDVPPPPPLAPVAVATEALPPTAPQAVTPDPFEVVEAEWDLPAPATGAAQTMEVEPLPGEEPDEATTAAPASAPVSAPQSLAGAFSALLAAEQARPFGVKGLSQSPALTEAVVEEVVRRVVSRVTDEVVRKVVSETTERLIREEMERFVSRRS